MNFNFPPESDSSMASADPFYAREKEKYGTPIPSREYLLEQLQGLNLPLKFLEIANLFGLTRDDEKTALKHRLLAMVRDGQLERNHRQQFFCVKELAILTGTVVAHREGFGFLKVNEIEKPLFISPKQMRKVLHGDIIAAQPLGESSNRAEVRILNILVPRDPKFVGICKKCDDRWIILPYIPFLLPQFELDPATLAGDLDLYLLHDLLVVAEITERSSKKSPAKAKILKILGNSHTQGIEKELAIQGHGLPFHWPPAVVHDIEAMGDDPNHALFSDAGNPHRVDCTHLPFVTIDGEDSKDFDDAVYCELTSTGWKLFVAIADVSHFVPMGCAIDLEAKKRGTSVYFPREVIPMLPAILSENLCSLLPHQKRLAIICEMTISSSGQCEIFEFYPAKICSKARLTYPEVAQALPDPLHPLMQAHPSLSHLLSLLKVRIEHRESRGALDLNLEASGLIFSESGEVESIIPQKRDLAHCLIEEAMILANIAAAHQLIALRAPALFRTHSAPSPSRLERLRPIWKNVGAPFPSKINRQRSVLEILKAAQNLERSDALQVLVLRTLRPAIYEPKNSGHFGLALKAYTHFTSPIRRYPDLIVHRILKRTWSDSTQPSAKKRRLSLYSRKELMVLADHCNLTERRADYASKDVLDWLKIHLAQKHLGQKMVGIVSGFNAQQLFVKIPHLGIEGVVGLKSLLDSPKKLNLEKQCAHSCVGRLTLGTELWVEIVECNATERMIALKVLMALN